MPCCHRPSRLRHRSGRRCRRCLRTAATRPAQPSISNANASANSWFLPPLPLPRTVTVVSPPHSRQRRSFGLHPGQFGARGLCQKARRIARLALQCIGNRLRGKSELRGHLLLPQPAPGGCRRRSRCASSSGRDHFPSRSPAPVRRCRAADSPRRAAEVFPASRIFRSPPTHRRRSNCPARSVPRRSRRADRRSRRRRSASPAAPGTLPAPACRPSPSRDACAPHSVRIDRCARIQQQPGRFLLVLQRHALSRRRRDQQRGGAAREQADDQRLFIGGAHHIAGCAVCPRSRPRSEPDARPPPAR